MEEHIFHTIMKELCEEMDIKLEKLSYDWILQLSKDGKVRHIIGRRFDLNPEATGDIACDKYATYEVLKSQNVPVIKHVMIFNPETRASFIMNENIWDIVNSELKKHGSLVIKSNDGFGGNGVYLCHNIKEAKTAIQELFKKQNSISVCPYYNIKTEYRTFYLDGEVKLIYGKTKPFIIGDGKSTVGELVENLNLPDKHVVKENLEKLNLTYTPKLGEKIDISWKHNLSGGAKPTILQKGKLYNDIEKLAIQAGKAMNIKFATIDVIETTDDELYVLEINSGIGAAIFIKSVDKGREMLKDIFRDAVKKLFE